ncbi:MAG: hypothetical protein KIT31_08415 [Deltaproteobacteria bacterium]|nr:hypothetical protein [Deltaproteobacteria bacterium]
MRTAGLLITLVIALATGCKGKSEADPSSQAPDPAAIKAQQELMARRDELVAKRQKLEGERDKLDAEIQKVKEKGGDTSELAKQRDALDSQLKDQTSEFTNLTSKLDQVVAQGGVAAREAGMSTRETNMSTREKNVNALAVSLADREERLAQRERDLAQREKETCGVGGSVIVQQVAAPRGENYTRKDIEPLLNRARATIAKKGLLPNDLGPAANLEGESTKAMADNNWGKAYLAAAQLAATVDAVKIDRNFISAKYTRLNNRVTAGGKLDESTTSQLTEGMKEVLQKYGDGDFAAANRRLNQLWALMR